MRIAFVVVLALLMAACMSTRERYQKGIALEREGRYAEAAEYYIKVLEKEPTWENARDRLRDVGARAVDAYLQQAEAAEGDGDYADAVDILDRMDVLRDDADAVGVVLHVPDGYDAYRRRLAADAVEALFREAEQAERRGAWDEALRAYERAGRYADDPERESERVERIAGLHYRWADDEARRGHYRAAFDHAQQTIDVLGDGHPLARRALALQDEALSRGTYRVVFLSLWGTEAARRSAPRHFLDELNDVLVLDYWSHGAPFIAAADPIQVAREVRRLRLDRHSFTRTEAAELGRAFDADLVVTGDLTDYTVRDRDVTEREHRVKLKGRGATVGGPADTTFVERRVRRAVDAELSFRIVDPSTRRVLESGTVDASESARIRYGVYTGDYRDLDLSGAQLELFEDEEQRGMQTLYEALTDELADRLAKRVYERLLTRIP